MGRMNLNLVLVSVNCVANMFGEHTKQSQLLTHRCLRWAHGMKSRPLTHCSKLPCPQLQPQYLPDAVLVLESAFELEDAE